MSTQTEFILIDARSESVPSGRRIHAESDQALVVDPQFYSAPLQIDCTLQIEGAAPGLRLLFAAGQVLFGEEGGETLCWVDPLTGVYLRRAGAGHLPSGTVQIQLHLTATGARLLVNGEERFTTTESYGREIASQVGLGVPVGAQVIVQSLQVTGEAVTLGHKLQKDVPLDFDGGLVDTLYDQHAQVLAWYTEQLRLKGHTWLGPVDREADATLFSTLSLPDFGAFHLYSVLTRKRLAHWYSERGTVDGHLRFCLECPHLARTHADLTAKGIRTGEIQVGPEGREYFDFYGPEGTRLTAVSYPEQAEAYPEAVFTKFAPPQIGVTDLAASVRWYQEVLGMRIDKDDSPNGFVSMDAWLWLEQVAPESHLGQVDGAAKPYFVCRSRQQFTELHERLAQAGARPSGYMNPPGGRWCAFHLYDPDGNRLNIWSYY